jgi:hypothetical protein
MRERDGQRVCMYHPDVEAPPMDLLSGKLRDPKDPAKPKAIAAPPARPKPAVAPQVDFGDVLEAVLLPPAERERLDVDAMSRSLQQDLDELERTDPAVAAAAESLAAVSARIVERAQPARVAPPTQRLKPPARPRPFPERPADGLCVVDGCGLSWRHGGKCQNPVDEADLARRYQAGERMYDLAEDFHIGVRRVRAILRAHNVQIRPRGTAIDGNSRDPGRHLDVDECRRLYATGLETTHVASILGVNTRRVRAQLATDGLLRRPASVHIGAVTDVRIKLSEQESLAARNRAHTLGLPLNGYLRHLIEADLRTSSSPGEVV